MPGSTPTYGLPYQALTDPPHGPDLGQDLAEAVETELERIDGDIGDLQTDVTALQTPPMVTTSAASFSQTTSTSYTTAVTSGWSSLVGVAFVAPPSGSVLIHFAATLDNTGSNTTRASPEVRTGGTVGSGSAVVAANDDNDVRNQGTNEVRYGNFLPVTGLTPGATYNVTLLHRVTAGTGIIDERTIAVVPVP